MILINFSFKTNKYTLKVSFVLVVDIVDFCYYLIQFIRERKLKNATTIILDSFKVAIYSLRLNFYNFDLRSKYCLSSNLHVKLTLQLILNSENKRQNSDVHNYKNSIDQLNARRDNLLLTKLTFETNMLINCFCNTSFILIVIIVCIYNKRTTRNTFIFKTNSCAIKKSYLKHLFLANEYIDNSILKDSQRQESLINVNKIRRDYFANKQLSCARHSAKNNKLKIKKIKIKVI